MRLACGISCTLSQYSLPLVVIGIRYAWVRRHEQVGDEVVFLRRRARLAAAAALLRAVLGERRALHVAGVARA